MDDFVVVHDTRRWMDGHQDVGMMMMMMTDQMSGRVTLGIALCCSTEYEVFRLSKINGRVDLSSLACSLSRPLEPADTYSATPAPPPLSTLPVLPPLPPLPTTTTTTMPPPQLFGPFPVAPQIFHTTSLSFALVNLKPLRPGHVLVCPRRVVPRLHDLSAAETTDLFATVQRVARTVARMYRADGLNVAVQDGAAAGQSVPHVHVHVIPRGEGDGEGDGIYERMEGEEGDLRRGFRVEGERRERGRGEMEEEAGRLRGEMEG